MLHCCTAMLRVYTTVLTLPSIHVHSGVPLRRFVQVWASPYMFNILWLSSVLTMLSFVRQQILVVAPILWKLASY